MKTLRMAGGFILIALGVVMLVTPGPGWVAIGLGLSLLAVDHEWARHWLDRFRAERSRLVHRIGRG